MSEPSSGQPVIPAFLQSGRKRLLIRGKWVEAASGKTFGSTNPSTGEALVQLAEADATDVDRAVAAAREAFEGPWSRLKPYDRQELLLRLADLVERNFDELALLDALDMGGPITMLKAGKRRILSMIRFYAGLATVTHGETIENSIRGDVFSYTRKEPVGVVGAIIPWNSPLQLAVWKIAPALATGCTVVLKPSEHAALSPLRLGELIEELGIPPGVLNIVTGFGAVGAALAAHPGVDKIAFTGSTLTGQAIIRASAGNIKRLSLELGGKSPDIVFADANMDKAVAGAALAAFANTGQACSAGTRLFVEKKIYEEFTARVADYGNALRVGSSLDPQTQIGPISSQPQLDRVLGYLDIGRREGARALCGGERLTGGAYDQGFFVRPTVYTDVNDDMAIAREEIFGPVISALPFEDLDDVIARANRTPFGLGSGVWTRDMNKVQRLAASIRAGSVWVNCYQAMDPAVPFGGYKMSGYGRESGVEHMNEFLNTKAVFVKAA